MKRAKAISCNIFLQFLVWLVCITGFLYQTGSIFNMYFRYPFSVTLIEEVRKNIMFPAVTVCLHRWINISRLCLYQATVCAPENQQHSDGRFFLQWDPIGRRNASHTPRELILCQLRSTVSTCVSVDCTPFVRRTYFRLPADMCFTVDNYQWNSPDNDFQRCTTPWNYEMEIKSIWDPNVTMALRESTELPVIVHRPYTVPPDRLSSIMIEPGVTYTITVSQQKLRRLPAPYSSDCVDYMAMGKHEMYFGYKTQDICIQECKMEVELEICKCIKSEHEFGPRYAIKQVCTLLNEDFCVQRLAKLDNVYGKCYKRCRAACEEVIYDVRLTSLAEDLTAAPNDRKSRFLLTVKFSSDTQKIYEYQPNLSLIESFGYTGGYMGIWLGFSLLSTSLGIYRRLYNWIYGQTEKKKMTAPPVFAGRAIIQRRF